MVDENILKRVKNNLEAELDSRLGVRQEEDQVTVYGDILALHIKEQDNNKFKITGRDTTDSKVEEKDLNIEEISRKIKENI
jgi:hypothetical protein